MSKFLAKLQDLLQDDRGVSSIEYAFLGIMIAMAILSSVIAVSDAVKSMYEMIASNMP
ncbi:MAG TPA: Flp family type IVb pilin [Pseudoduganella sp.]